MTAKITAFVTRRDFDQYSTIMAEFGYDGGKYKRLTMTVDHWDIAPIVYYEVYDKGFRVGGKMTDLAEATRVYNGAGPQHR